jgi:putative CocE/NonD family hydrolase
MKPTQGARAIIGHLFTWPAYKNKYFYMHGSTGKAGILSETAPSATTAMSYKYDPTTTDGITPIMGGNNLPFIGKIHACGSADQTKRDARKDVLVFDSAKLPDHMAVVGNITANVFVSSDAVDTDFVAVVSDVGPKKAMMVRYGAVRMRWRSSDEVTSPPLEAGKVYEADIDLGATAYIFPKGHRVRITISSAAYPYFDANTNNGSPESSPQPAIAANNAFHMGPKLPSYVSLPVVKMEDIPHNRLFGASFPDPVGLAKALRETIVV